MKKKILVTSLVGMVLFGGSYTVYGVEGDYQTIDNSSGIDVQTEASVPTNGILGRLDNTDPELPIPEGDDKWINVTLPTEVVFNSDAETEHTEIESPIYDLKNNSGRPVAVSVTAFDTIGEQTSSALKVLQLTSMSTEGEVPFSNINVLTEGKTTIEKPVPLVTLGNIEGLLNEQKIGNAAKFSYTGKVDTAKLDVEDPEKAVEVNYNLGLKFTALQADGTLSE